jgi:CheY-like chemotaxis protein
MARGGFYSVDSLNGVHVLLVSADPGTRDVVASVLTYCGALVTPVTSASDAIEVLRRMKADLVVAETGWPDEDGAALVREMRSRKPEDGGVIPVVALMPRSAASNPDAPSGGFDAVLAMPIDPWALCRLIAGFSTST